MIKLPPFVSEIVINITNFIGAEPSRSASAIIISTLIVASIVTIMIVFSMLRSLFRRNERSNSIEAQTKAQAINAAIAPSRSEYERIIHDAIETALLPINRRVKRLEDKIFSAAEGLQPTATPQLYDDVQDVVLPQADEVTSDETKVQATNQHTVFAEEETEYTTIAKIQAVQQREASPPSEDTGLQAVPPSAEEDNTVEQDSEPDQKAAS